MMKRIRIGACSTTIIMILINTSYKFLRSLPVFLAMLLGIIERVTCTVCKDIQKASIFNNRNNQFQLYKHTYIAYGGCFEMEIE